MPPGLFSLTYNYQPLIAANNEIRILDIEPANSYEEELQCNLIHVPLETSSNYTALSYCWGCPDRTVPIKVNKWIIYITPSLAAALRDLRHRRIFRVWADALCINQSDLEERSHQVLRMAAIYRTARSVATWLGHCPDATTRKLIHLKEGVEKLLRFNSSGDFYQRFDPTLHGTQDWTQEDEILTTEAQFKDSDSPDGQRRRKRGLMRVIRGVSRVSGYTLKYELKKSPKSRRANKHIRANLQTASWAPLKSLLSCEYWCRAWITQELSMANRLSILWGREVFSFGDLTFLVVAYKILLKEDLVEDIIPPTYCQHIHNLLKFKELQAELKPVPLAKALRMASFCKSTDPRDKVYAIMGLTYNGSIIFPSPSYGRGLWNINADATLRVIRLDHSLNHIVARKNSPRSWIIDWFDSETWSDTQLVSYFTDGAKFKKEHWDYSDAATIPQGNPGVSIQNRHLVVQGLIVDTIRITSATYEERNPDGKPRAAIETPQLKDKGEDKHPKDFRRILSKCFCMLRSEEIYTESFYLSLQFILQNQNSRNKQNQKNIYTLNKVIEWAGCAGNSNFKVGSRSLTECLEPTRSKFTWPSQAKRDKAARVVSVIHGALRVGMRLGETTEGKMGWFTKYAQAGDKVAILSGCSVPVVLRDRGDGSYLIVGDSVIYRASKYRKNRKFTKIKLF